MSQGTPWKLLGFHWTEDRLWPDFADIKHDYTQEFYRSYSYFISQCPRTSKFRCVCLYQNKGAFWYYILFFNCESVNLFSGNRKCECTAAGDAHFHTCDNQWVHFQVKLGNRAHFQVKLLTHWGRDKMDAISQTTFSSAFSWKKMWEFRLKFHWSLFLRVQLTIFQHCFR